MPKLTSDLTGRRDKVHRAGWLACCGAGIRPAIPPWPRTTSFFSPPGYSSRRR